MLQVIALRQNDEIPNGDVSRSRQHEQDRFGDFRGLQQASCGQLLLELRLGPVLDQGGDHGAWGDGADAQSVFRNLTPHCMYEGLHSMLGGRVDRLPDYWDETSNRAGDDDIACLT